MPNQINSLVSGLLTGLKGLGEGYVQKKTQQNAMDLYNEYADKLSRNYEETMFRTQNVLAGINPKRAEYEQQQKEKVSLDKGVENEQIQGLINTLSQLNPMQEPRQQVQAPNRPIPNNTDYLRTILEGIGKLGMNPLGKTYASALEMLYKDMTAPDELKSFDTDKDVYKMNRQTGRWELVTKGVKESKQQQVTGVPYSLRKDETTNKYYLKLPMRDNVTGNIAFQEVEIDENEYGNYYDLLQTKTLSPEEKNQYALDLYQGKRDYMLSTAPPKNSGRKSGKTAKEIMSELGKDALTEVDKYNKVSAEFYGKYGEFDPNTSDPKKLKLQNQLVAERERLANKYFGTDGSKVDELNAYYFGEGKNLKKEVNRKVSSPDNINTGNAPQQQQESVTNFGKDTIEKIKQLKQQKRTYEQGGIIAKIGSNSFDIGRKAGRDSLTKYLYKLYNDTEDKEAFLGWASQLFNQYMQDPNVPNDFKQYISQIRF